MMSGGAYRLYGIGLSVFPAGEEQYGLPDEREISGGPSEASREGLSDPV